MLLQFAELFNVIYRQMDIPAVVEATSLDAAQAIYTAEKTELFNDNQWRPYGPLYYRLSKITSYFSKNSIKSDYIDQRDSKLQIISFNLLFVSLASILAFSFILSNIVSDKLINNLISFCIINYALLSIEDISHLALMNHPDILMSLIAVIYYYLIVKFLQDNNKSLLIVIGLLGGFGFLTKISFFIIFIPGIIAIYTNNNSYKNFLKIILYTFLFYFIIGFPQSLKINGVINFLLEQNGYRDKVSLESILFWLNNIFSGIYIVIIPLFLLIFAFGGDKSFLSLERLKENKISYVSLFLGPVLIISTISFSHRPSYYVVPIIFCLIFLLTLISHSFYVYFIRTRNYSEINRKFFISLSILFIYINFSNTLIPNNFIRINEEIINSRLIAKKTILAVEGLPKGSVMLKTAYFPAKDPSVESISSIEIIKKYIDSGTAEYLLVSKSWYGRYLKPEPSKYDLGGESYDNFKSMHNFWMQIDGDQENVVINGWSYKMVFQSGNNRIYQLIKKKIS